MERAGVADGGASPFRVVEALDISNYVGLGIVLVGKPRERSALSRKLCEEKHRPIANWDCKTVAQQRAIANIQRKGPKFEQFDHAASPAFGGIRSFLDRLSWNLEQRFQTAFTFSEWNAVRTTFPLTTILERAPSGSSSGTLPASLRWKK